MEVLNQQMDLFGKEHQLEIQIWGTKLWGLIGLLGTELTIHLVYCLLCVGHGALCLE